MPPPMKSASSSASVAVAFTMDGAAATVAKTGVAPVKRVKLLLQNQGEMLRMGVCSCIAEFSGFLLYNDLGRRLKFRPVPASFALALHSCWQPGYGHGSTSSTIEVGAELIKRVVSVPTSCSMEGLNHLP